MKKNPPVCPKCGTAFDVDAVLRTRRRAAPEEKAKKPEIIAAVAPDDIDDIEPIEGDSEESVIEDAAELGDEEAELGEVVELKDDGPDADAER